ncbi:MAG TPA: nucleoside hydrolase [Candidatus Hydrogenedentes bacterium]|nr:nucleoside hydrolase [Candidatus Hydrogenedentota bacterium]
MQIRRSLLACVLFVLFVVVPLAASGEQAAPRIPIVYCTDLFHPHGDPDDHFDLATLFALPELDVRAIVIDMGREGEGRPGLLTVRQMTHLTGRGVPTATGLASNLDSLEDTGRGQPPESQAGVALILDALRAADEPVTVFITGSLRDFAAAYNRAPDLVREKVGRCYVNAGHSSGGAEWNVQLDPVAFVRIMRSGLPIYWVPCFGDGGYESLWTFDHEEVLEGLPGPIQNFFLYALDKTDPAQVDPIAALGAPVSAERKARFWKEKRNMWCTAAFLHAAGREQGPFTFERARVKVEDNGKTTPALNEEGVALHVLRVDDSVNYRGYMAGTLRDLLAGLPLAATASAEE